MSLTGKDKIQNGVRSRELLKGEMQLPSRRQTSPVQATQQTARARLFDDLLRHRTTFLENFDLISPFCSAPLFSEWTKEGRVTNMAASVIGATRRRRLLVASNHGTAGHLPRHTNVPAPVTLFSYIMPVKAMT